MFTLNDRYAVLPGEKKNRPRQSMPRYMLVKLLDQKRTHWLKKIESAIVETVSSRPPPSPQPHSTPTHTTKFNMSSSGGSLCKTTALVQSGTVAKVRPLEPGTPEPVMTPFLATSITEPFLHFGTSVSVPAKAGIITPISMDEISCYVSDRLRVKHAVDS